MFQIVSVIALVFTGALCQANTSPQSIAENIINDSLQQAQDAEKDALKFIESLDQPQNIDKEQSFFNFDQSSSNEEPLKEEPSEGEIDLNTSLKIKNTANSCSGKCSSLKTESNKQPLKNTSSELIVFVTLAMKDKSLKAYSRDISKAGGRLVIRGLVKDSFRETQKRLRDLGIEVDIDPVLFDRFDVKEVPTIILSQHNSHDSLKGNVSLSYALEQFKEHGITSAEEYLTKLKGSKA